MVFILFELKRQRHRSLWPVDRHCEGAIKLESTNNQLNLNTHLTDIIITYNDIL